MFNCNLTLLICHQLRILKAKDFKLQICVPQLVVVVILTYIFNNMLMLKLEKGLHGYQTTAHLLFSINFNSSYIFEQLLQIIFNPSLKSTSGNNSSLLQELEILQWLFRTKCIDLRSSSSYLLLAKIILIFHKFVFNTFVIRSYELS